MTGTQSGVVSHLILYRNEELRLQVMSILVSVDNCWILVD